MNKLIFLAACWLPVTTSCAQPVHFPFSDVYTGIGAYSRNSTDAFSFSANQASLARMKGISGGIYSERLYSVKELTHYSGALVMPVSKGSLGISGRFSGYDALRYIQMGIAYGLSLSGEMDIGLQFNYSRINMPGYGSTQAFTAEAGTMIQVSDGMICGFHLSHIGSGLLNKARDGIPAPAYSLGLGYEISDKLLLKLELCKEDESSPLLIPGIQYNIKKQVFVRAAMTSGTGTFTSGAGLKWKNVRADLAASFHSRLGITPSLLIILTSPDH